ncbi:tyrosine-type recombinase/integrase [Hyphococcus sp.]|uniref:tyrosine-type recombinase/integrase n=2 Tax=Hyphococcus sp. TaxID=2038636 RepID=UPI0035C6D91F
MAVVKLTEKRIRDLPLGAGIFRDKDVKGLMVVSHKTTKTYACQGDVRRNGRHVRTVRVKIDRCDRIGLAEARRRAKAIMSTIQSGVDPTAGPRQSGVTVAEALEAHLSERELRPSTERSYRDHLERYLVRLRGRAVADVSRQDVRELLDDLTRKHGRTSAAGALRTLRAVINTARRMDETIGANPVDAVRVPVPPRREVDALDVAAFWKETEELSPVMRDLQRAFLFTGARRSSLLTVRRDDVDLERGVLRFAHMKTGGELLFPMGKRMTEICAVSDHETDLGILLAEDFGSS